MRGGGGREICNMVKSIREGKGEREEGTGPIGNNAKVSVASSTTFTYGMRNTVEKLVTL